MDERIIALLIFGAAVLAGLVIWSEKAGRLDRALRQWQIKHGFADWSVYDDEDIRVPEDLEDVIVLVNDK